MIEKIKKYTQLNAVSGNETIIKNELQKVFKKHDTEIFFDNLGSICTLIPSGKEGTKNIGIFAHQDEVGLIVSQIMDNGNIKIANVGGIACKNLINQRVKMQSSNEDYIGVVLANYEKEVENLTISDLEVDFGFETKEKAIEQNIQIGDYINLIGQFETLGNNKFVTKAADDRIGCALVEQVYENFVKQKINCNLYLGATVQEEMGLKGAGTLLRSLDVAFDHIIIVDVSPIDNIKENELGAGFLLRVAEPRALYDYQGNLEIQKLAEENQVKYQKYFSKGSTDGAMMQITQDGNKTNAICIPALNLHTGNTICNINDVKEALKMIEVYIKNEK